MLHEGDKTNKDYFHFHFNVSDLYEMNLSFIKYCQSSWFCRLKFDKALTNELISYMCIFSLCL